MVISIIGMVIGIIVAIVGCVYLVREKDDKDSRKIYGTISVIGLAVFVAMLVKLIFEIM